MKIETLLTVAGRNPEKHEGTVNPPVYHASTIIYPNLTEFKKRGDRRYYGVSYGTHGTPTSLALARAVSDLEKGHASVVTSSLVRSVVPWNEKGYLVRFHTGLEDPDDLLSDLSQGLKRINKV